MRERVISVVLTHPQTAIQLSTAGVLLGALLLGGNAGTGHFSDVVLQMIAVPALLLALWNYWSHPSPHPFWTPVILAAIATIPLLQLVPLPPSIWGLLPQRDVIRSSYEIMESALPWLPVSTAPAQTWLGVVSLVVPFAVFLGTVQLGFRARRLLCVVLLGTVTVAGMLGLIQIVQGPTSPLRFYAFTNLTEAVGFFANRNHHAALLYVGLIFASAFALNSAMTVASSAEARSGKTVVTALASLAVILVLVASQAVARSRAGLLLSVVALFGTFGLALLDTRAQGSKWTIRLVAASVGLALLFTAQFTVFRVMERFAVDPFGDASRVAFRRTTLEAAWSYFPFGSGIGSFVPVYALFEKEQDILVGAYVNQAHNDVAQVLLEGGLPAALLVAILLFAGAVRTYQIWWTAPLGRLEIDRTLARAAPLVIALLLLHAFADYALRTGAIMATLAFAAALLFPPPEDAEAEQHLPFEAVEASTARRKSSSNNPTLARNAVWSKPIAGPQTGTPAPPIAWAEPSAPVQSAATPAVDVHWPKDWGKPEVNVVPPERTPGIGRSQQSGKPTAARPVDAPAPPPIHWPIPPSDKS